MGLMHIFLFLFLWSGAGFAEDLSQTIRIADYTIDVLEREGAGAELIVRVDHFGEASGPDYRAWWKARSRNKGDRMGLREYWLHDSAGYDEDSLLNEAKKLYPESVAAGVLEIHLRADSEDLETAGEWQKLRFIPKPKAYYSVLPIFTTFFSKHEPFFLAQEEKLKKMLENAGPDQDKWASIENSLNFFILFHGRPIMETTEEQEQAYARAARDGLYAGPIAKKRYQTEIPNRPALFVTHATQQYDFSRAAKPMIDALIERFKGEGRPVVYLVHDDGLEDFTWYTNDRKPDLALYSFGGEHSFLVSHPEVTMVGGWFDQCFRRSVQDVISRYFLKNRGELRIHLPMAGIYVQEMEAATLLDLYRKKTPAALKKYIDDNFIWTPEPLDDSMDGDKDAIGYLNLKLYCFEIYIDGKLLFSHGRGSRHVKLLFSSAMP